ncbi:MAG TPA: GNAT family N-acetyltransferase [Sphingomicrobium sp.]|nr:GNAT family N-acetyltransferase [Sphingomicrobium sp.]
MSPAVSDTDRLAQSRQVPPPALEITETIVRDGHGGGRSTEIVSEPAAFAALEAPWRDLSASLASPLLGFDWFDSWRRALGEPELAVIAVRDGPELRAALPLMIDRTTAIPVLRPLDHFAYEVNAFPVINESALALGCEGAIGLGRPLVLLRLISEGAELECLRHLADSGGRGVIRPARSLVSVPLEGSWDAVQAAMRSSSRTFIRRKLKIAERAGPVHFEAFAPDATNVDEHLDTLFRIEDSGWKRTAGTSLRADRRIGTFIANYGRASARAGTLRMFYLRIGGATAAIRMAVEHRRKLWELKIGYDERFAPCSPGILLMHLTLQHACETGLKGYEFLGSQEGWHNYWPNVVTPCSSFRFYPFGIAGTLRFAIDAGNAAFKRVKTRSDA